MFGDDGYQQTHINSSTTTQIIAAIGAGVPPKGILGGVTYNAPGTSWSVTVYDGTAAQNVVIAALTPAANQPELVGPIKLKNGLTIVTSGATPGDLTVKWT